MGTLHVAGVIPAMLLAMGAGPLVQVALQSQLPYKSIDNPQFIVVSQATFLSSSDRVIGVVSAAVPKAYPAAILAQHGVVLDKLPDGPIAVTW